MKLIFKSLKRQAFVAVAIVAAGCGQVGPVAGNFDTVAAKGVLTSGGKPLAYYQVMLVPEGQRPATGTTDEQGNFVLGTNYPGDGAVVGKHKVVISYIGPPSNITPDMDNYKPPKPPVKLLKKYGSEQTTDLTVEVPAGGVQDLKIEAAAG